MLYKLASILLVIWIGFSNSYSQGILEFYCEDMEVRKIPAKRYDYIRWNDLNSYWKLNKEDSTIFFIKNDTIPFQKSFKSSAFTFPYYTYLSQDKIYCINGFFMTVLDTLKNEMNSYDFPSYVSFTNGNYVLSNTTINLKWFFINYLLGFKVQKQKFKIYSIENLTTNGNEFKKVKRKSLVRKFKISNKDCPHNISINVGSSHCYHDSFFYITSSNAHNIYKIHCRNRKLDSVFGQKGYFYSDSLVKNIQTKTDYFFSPSVYKELWIDTLNQYLYRMYQVGTNDTTITELEKYSKIKMFLQVYDLKTLKFIGEIPLKSFNNYTYPKYFYSQENKAYFWCTHLSQYGNFLIFSVKLTSSY